MYFVHFAHLTSECQKLISAESGCFAVYIETNFDGDSNLLTQTPVFTNTIDQARLVENRGGCDLVIGIPQKIHPPSRRIGLASGYGLPLVN